MMNQDTPRKQQLIKHLQGGEEQRSQDDVGCKK